MDVVVAAFRNDTKKTHLCHHLAKEVLRALESYAALTRLQHSTIVIIQKAEKSVRVHKYFRSEPSIREPWQFHSKKPFYIFFFRQFTMMWLEEGWVFLDPELLKVMLAIFGCVKGPVYYESLSVHTSTFLRSPQNTVNPSFFKDCLKMNLKNTNGFASFYNLLI